MIWKFVEVEQLERECSSDRATLASKEAAVPQTPQFGHSTQHNLSLHHDFVCLQAKQCRREKSDGQGPGYSI